jgi:hypothetical protein
MFRRNAVRLLATCLAMGVAAPFMLGAAATAATAPAPRVLKSFRGSHDNSGTPLDANGAIGPYSFLEDINTKLTLFSRTGAVLSSASLATITGHPNIGDPTALWDPDTQRFYYNVWDVVSNTQEWGFSKSADPRNVLTDFCNYTADFHYPAPQATDYPKLGQTKRFLLVGFNVYPNGASLHATHSDLAWIDKPQGSRPFTACPAASTFKTGKFVNLRNGDTTQAWTPVPAVQTDPSETGFVSASSDVECPDICGVGTLITEFQVSPSKSDPSVAVLSKPLSSQVPPFSPPPPARQKGSLFALDALDGRLDHAVSGYDPTFRTVTVWVAHTVAGGAGDAVAWYEIAPITGELLQYGLVSDPRLDVFNAGITNDRTVTPAGAAHGTAMVLSVTTSSATTFPVAAMVSKVGSGPVSAIVPVHASTVPDTDFSCKPDGNICRWGDYGWGAPDPASPMTGPTGSVWCTNEWTDGTNQSWIWEAQP